MDSITNSSTPAWASGALNERVWCQLCPNPSAMTLDGTNTWVLQAPGASEAIVVDPGPLDEQHLQQVLRVVHERDARVGLILLTHGHWDHAQSVDRFAQLTGAPVKAAGRRHRNLNDGDIINSAGLELVVVPTPGHTADSVSVLLPQDRLLLTGDTVLGRGTSVVSYPDGQLEAYLSSLRRIQALVADGEVTSIAPGHGPSILDAAGVVEFYLQHRKKRLDRVRAVVADESDGTIARNQGEELVDLVVRLVYADVPRSAWPAARLSVLAQLDYLKS